MGNDVDPEAHHRRSVRLKEYDYAQAGAYFVTICIQDWACMLGDVVNGELLLNELGQIVNEEWSYTALIRPNVALDVYVVMPNHLHGIVILADQVNGTTNAHEEEWQHTPSAPVGRGVLHTPSISTPGPFEYAPTAARPFRSPARTIGAIVRGFKASTNRRINDLRGTKAPVWQRNYYEHVIRNEADMDRIRAYIVNNPMRWAEDENNPAKVM